MLDVRVHVYDKEAPSANTNPGHTVNILAMQDYLHYTPFDNGIARLFLCCIIFQNGGNGEPV